KAATPEGSCRKQLRVDRLGSSLDLFCQVVGLFNPEKASLILLENASNLTRKVFLVFVKLRNNHNLTLPVGWIGSTPKQIPFQCKPANTLEDSRTLLANE